MKGSNSRFSHRLDHHYSNVAHVQGGMVTDADLTEAGQIHQARDEAQNTVTVRSGTPQKGGAVAFAAGVPDLAEGTVMAQGKQGMLRKSGAGNLFQAQADLPLGPAMPAGRALLYADVWERPVFALQDRRLSDPGLHGAETTYRTHTMTQIKAVPVATAATLADALAALDGNTGPFAQSGNATATVAPKNIAIATDDCDPCASEVEIEAEVPNALFRFEIIAVARNAAGVPTDLTVAWSMENGAAIMAAADLDDVSARDAFARPNAAYEFFSDATEAQIGKFPGGHAPERPVLTGQLFPVAPPAAGANGGQPFDHVRRWDGTAQIDLASRTATPPGRLSVMATKLQLSLEAFTLDIATTNRDIIAGDYWLVELRRFAPETDRVRLVSTLPHGVKHHFCALFEVNNGTGTDDISDADRRRLSYPALSDLPATHVAFDPKCPDLFDNAENVADALNALCDLNATEVAFDPGADCPRFEGTKTVDEALKKMCTIQDDTAISRVLRLMMDWGVVCGVKLSQEKRNSTTVQWTAGTMLDRSGRLIDVPAGAFDLRQLPPEQIHGKLNEIMEKNGEICLSLAAGKDDKIEVHLSAERTAFGPIDRNFRDAVSACIAGRKPVNFDDTYKKLSPADGKVIEKMVNVWANRSTLEGAVPMTVSEGVVAKAVNKTLLDDYVANAPEGRGARVVKMIASLEEELNPVGIRGRARENRLMQLEATKMGVIANSEEEDRVACECAHFLTPCPPDAGKAPYLVPVACISTDVGGENVITNLQKVCTFCCRKQSMNWRTHRYHFGNPLQERFQRMERLCCVDEEPPTRGVVDWVNDWDMAYYEPKPLPDPVPDPDFGALWPPKKIPDYRGGVFQDDPRITTPGRVFNVTPDVGNLSVATGTELLTGNGLNILETIDLDDASDPLAKIDALRDVTGQRLEKVNAEPGDNVVMMVRGGKAVDFIVVGKGSGRLPFETEAQTEIRVEKIISKITLPGKSDIRRPTAPTVPNAPTLPIAGLDAFEERLASLEVRKRESEADVTRLDDQLAKSRIELEKIETEKAAGLADIKEALQKLDRAKEEQGKLITGMRREQPVSAVIGDNARARKALQDAGITNVGQLLDTPSARLSRVLVNVGATSRTVLRDANIFLTK